VHEWQVVWKVQVAVNTDGAGSWAASARTVSEFSFTARRARTDDSVVPLFSLIIVAST